MPIDPRFQSCTQGRLDQDLYRAGPPYEMRLEVVNLAKFPFQSYDMPFTTHFYLIKSTPFMVFLPNWQKTHTRTFQEAEPDGGFCSNPSLKDTPGGYTVFQISCTYPLLQVFTVSFLCYRYSL